MEDERAVRALLRERVRDPGAQAPMHASSLLRALREVPGAEPVLLHAASGDVGGLAEFIIHLHDTPPRDVGDPRYSPALLHALSIFEERVGTALAASDAPPDRVDAAKLRALGYALGTAHHPEYLRAAARHVAGDALDEDAIELIARAWTQRILEAEGRTASAGANARRPSGKRALALLARVDEAAARVHLAPDAPVVRDARLHAATLRRAAIENALQPLEHDLEEAMARDGASARELSLMRQLVAFWNWTGQDLLVGRAILDRAVDLGWRYYQAKLWPTLEALDDATLLLVNDYAERQVVQQSELAYSAKIAQLLVFRAERSNQIADQIHHAETALQVCTTHRNARVVLADLLAARALRTLDQAPIVGRGPHRDRARADLLRARELWPGGSRLARAIERLAREGVEL